MNPQDTRPKGALQSDTIVGIIGIVLVTFGVLFASYNANGTVTTAELITAATSLAPAFYAIRGRFKATRPIKGLL